MDIYRVRPLPPSSPKLWMLAQLKSARLAKGWTQKELAEKLGKPQSYVSKYEVGERTLDFLEAVRVAKALSIKIQSLIPPELR